MYFKTSEIHSSWHNWNINSAWTVWAGFAFGIKEWTQDITPIKGKNMVVAQRIIFHSSYINQGNRALERFIIRSNSKVNETAFPFDSWSSCLSQVFQSSGTVSFCVTAYVLQLMLNLTIWKRQIGSRFLQITLCLHPTPVAPDLKVPQPPIFMGPCRTIRVYETILTGGSEKAARYKKKIWKQIPLDFSSPTTQYISE